MFDVAILYKAILKALKNHSELSFEEKNDFYNAQQNNEIELFEFNCIDSKAKK